ALTMEITEATVLGWIKDNQVVRSGRLEANEEVALLLDRTTFYAEQGGQVGDVGHIDTDTATFIVEDTQKLGDAVLHIGYVEDDPEGNWIECGQKVYLEVNMRRINTMRNHTATHLLNWALRKVLGDHIDQRGSLVDVEKTRFDFTHDKALSQGEIKQVEQLV